METSHLMDGGICIVKADNDGFADNAVEFRLYVEKLVADQSITKILINLRDLVMMDSSGIGIVVNFHNQMHEQQRFFGLCELGKHVIGVFQLTRLDKVLKIYLSEEEASNIMKEL